MMLVCLLLCVDQLNSQRSHIGCPDPSLCDKQGRKPCKPGSFRCGPCLSPWQENKKGHCEPMKHQHYGMRKKISMLSHSSALTTLTNSSIPLSTLHLTQTHFEILTRGCEIRTFLDLLLKYHKALNFCLRLFFKWETPPSVLNEVDDARRFQKESRLAEKVDYPAFGGASVPTSSMGDKTLAQSAQMFHYQHQKQQMLSMGNHKPEQKVSETEGTSDEEEVGGDFTVYECPGLAPTGEMEVKNPLFDDSAIPYQGNAK
uniref:Neural proliferation, differentiation and control, 1a n=1 Tax=Amphilophus citrinellus TaxID=61819 RepID=A0A3Q0T0Y9_AMPCI